MRNLNQGRIPENQSILRREKMLNYSLQCNFIHRYVKWKTIKSVLKFHLIHSWKTALLNAGNIIIL